ncbi:UNVERIFIED_CONTAM: Glycine-rich domain-containing protein 2 [Sesamum radiatum]|uniref:Glycine-rich domain-containing protein 2 n=1 Tax=Sesamum radiatum TaxID=300843 RepID=A0AAW2VSW3_SESRA
MEREQELEWEAAQSIKISVDLVAAAKQQLKFLAAVDRNRWLYEGQGLDRAIYRYNEFWLPLLAKHSESQLLDGPLVVPLDCEWIWHCHRLNPVRYKLDCEEFYGRILDNQNVVSSAGEASRSTTEEVWKNLYPGEPYELDLNSARQDNIHGRNVGGEKCTKYDLIAAVQRQTPFFYQVSRPHMIDDRYLEGSVARYKGFLHLIKRNKERYIRSFSVPTYDIDLIWHTHQLHPVSYCKDLAEIMGQVLEHDDTDSDRTEGQKLDVGFSGTTKIFEEMYGSRYWRAGAMYHGYTPSSVRTTPYFGVASKTVTTVSDSQKIKLPEVNVLEVMLEVVGVRNLPEGHNGSLLVSLSKTQPDVVFNAKRSLNFFSESGEKQVASFHCQPTGHLSFELMYCSHSRLQAPNSSKTMGTTSISMEDFLSSQSSLKVEKWLELLPNSNIIESKPIGLLVAISVTIPTKVPYVLHTIHSQPFSKTSYLFPFPVRARFAKSWTNIIDEAGNLVMSLHMRNSKKSRGKGESMRKEVVGITESAEKCTLAEFAESKWSLVNSPWSLRFPITNNDDGHLLELIGPQTVRLFVGGRLDYELKHCEKHKAFENHLITAIEFSHEYPYGRAVALLDFKSGTVKVNEEWFLLPAFVLSFIFASIFRKEGYNTHIVGIKTLKQKGNALMPSESCNAKCGNGVGSDVRTLESGECGRCGGGGCGNMAGGSGGGNRTKNVAGMVANNGWCGWMTKKVMANQAM